jgi:hypothetical protein
VLLFSNSMSCGAAVESRVGKSIEATANADPKRRILMQARSGVVVGLLLGLLLNGFVKVPAATVYAALNADVSLIDVAERLTQGRYRVVMHCPVKNNHVTYNVMAQNAGRAHIALEWVAPACQLSKMAETQPGDPGKTWYRGDFHCLGPFNRRTHSIMAGDMHLAMATARAVTPNCRVETVLQTSCPFLNPRCERRTESFEVEAAFEKHRMLR